MSENKIALSVVIPVYNAERTLPEALDSLLGQSLAETEVICVDDGSTDSSVEIIRKYAGRDERVRLLQQENQFAGAARNTGMEAARGEFLFFLDADDYVLDYALEAAYLKCVKYNLDCLKFRSLTLDEQSGRYIFNEKNEFNSLEPGDWLRLLTPEENSPLFRISITPWSGMYRRSFLLDHGCRFNTLRCVNDRSFYCKLITCGGRIMCSPGRVTVHRVNQKDSLVGRKAEHFDCQIRSIRIIEDQMKTDGTDDCLRDLVMRQEYEDLLVWYRRLAADAGVREEMDRKIGDYLREDRSGCGVILQDMMKAADLTKAPGAPEERKPFHPVSQQPKVSVIVPIMNVEDYLNLALESLTNQTLEDMEFIILNDGSTDHSLTIMKEYAEIDKRFVIVDKKNSGYGHTMNTGIDMARGEYIGILEPDDFVEPHMFGRLYEEAERYRLDFVKSDFSHFWINPDGSLKKKTVLLSPDDSFYNRTLSPEKEKETFFFPINTWSGIYRRDFLNRYHIRHHETPGASFQDNGFWFQTFCHGKRVRFIRDRLYVYRRDNPNSSMLSRKKENCVTEEYRWIHGLLEKDPRLLAEFEDVMYNKQWLSMLLTLSRLEAGRKLPYLRHIREELKEPYERGLYQRNYLHPFDLKRLDRIMEDPEAYYNTVDISVIVPVYNAEKYVEECLRSVLFRSNVNIEVICVDDGSTDSSPEILRRMAEQDCRIHVYTTANRGAGAARNEGLKHARGEYLSFLDADDFFDTDMLDRAWNRAKLDDLDIVVFRSDNFLTDTQKFTAPQGCREELLPANRPFAGTDVGQDVFRLFVGWAWDKLFRASFVREKGLSFAELGSSNDLSFVFTAVAAAERIGYFPCEPLAHHRRYSGSISTSREKTWDCFYHALLELRENLKRLGLYERFERDYINYCLYFSIWQMTTVKEDGYEKVYRKLASEWFDAFGVSGKPREYFYNRENYDMMLRMKTLSPEDFLLQMFNQFRNRPAGTVQTVDNPAILGSVSYRIGRAATWLPRKARSGVRLLKDAGPRKAWIYGIQKGRNLLRGRRR